MTTPTTQSEFFQTNAIDGVLTPEQAAQLMELPEGDTGLKPENGSAPSATTATSNTTDDMKVPKDGTNNDGATPNVEHDASNTVIIAKDGKHTIGYEKLVAAREGEKHWKAQAEATQAELASLKEQAAQREAAGAAPTTVDNQVKVAEAAIAQGIDPAIFGDFSEEDLAKGIQTLVDQRVEARVDAAISKRLAPLQEKQAKDAKTEHYEAIYKAHPDADSMFESKELADWIAAQPSFAQAGYKAVLEQGSTAQIIELFDKFTEATGRTPADPLPDGGKGAAKAALAAARTEPPASLSGIPGGRADGLSPQERMAGMTDGGELYVAMENMTSAQIEAYLNKQL